MWRSIAFPDDLFSRNKGDHRAFYNLYLGTVTGVDIDHNASLQLTIPIVDSNKLC